MLLAPALVLAQQVVPTVQSTFVMAGGEAYVPSPVYVVKPVTPDEVYGWSPDGTRLATVSATTGASPRSIENKLANGLSPHGNTRIGVWSKDTGRAVDVFVAQNATTGIGGFTFAGSTLVFATFDGGVGSTVHRLWTSRAGQSARPLDLAGFTGGAQFVASKSGDAVLLTSGPRAWVLKENATLPVSFQGYEALSARGLTPKGRALVAAMKQASPMEMFEVDFATGTAARIEEPTLPRVDAVFDGPFVLDVYRLNGRRLGPFTIDHRADHLDEKPAMIAEEDGGYRMDVVEASGEKRRRIPFVHEMSSTVFTSPDFLNIAFVSNKTLMVRSLVKVSEKERKRLLGEK